MVAWFEEDSDEEYRKKEKRRKKEDYYEKNEFFVASSDYNNRRYAYINDIHIAIEDSLINRCGFWQDTVHAWSCKICY